MIDELKRTVQHDCALIDYRSPLGAVKTDDSLIIKIAVRHREVKGVSLVLYGENYEKRYEMGSDGKYYQTCVSVPKTPCVLWYYFILHTAERPYYYGAKSGAAGDVYFEYPPAYQLTVYDKHFQTPAWFKKAVMYQIFPDRFHCHSREAAESGIEYHRSMGRNVKLHASWDEPVDYLAAEGEEYYRPCDFYGGTLKGVEQKLGYLKKLGASVVYLNPVFEADSNHRYNTSDYMRIDPILGCNEDFKNLARAAARQGVKIMLDGVFSHTGSDSVYFNKYGRYPSKGAYDGEESPYYKWYDFIEFPEKYRSWWGFDTLPEVNEHDPDWQDFIIKNENSVLKTWLKNGASGYRLDVADELPDDVLEEIRKSVKEQDANAVVLGEVWENPTTKQSYGVNRRYALGNALDSVMNYPLRNAIVDFVLYRSDAFALCAFLMDQRLNYPLPMYYSLMNLLSSHDIERIRTALASRLDPHSLTREKQATFVITQKQRERGRALQKLCAVIQYSLPGVPCLYYGDEMGMEGFLDPFNRQPFEPSENELAGFYEKLGGVRNSFDALSVGHIAFFTPNADTIGILRFIQDGCDPFGERAENGFALTVVNRSADKQNISIDLFQKIRLIDSDQRDGILGSGLKSAECLLTGMRIPLENGLINLALNPECAHIFIIK